MWSSTLVDDVNYLVPVDARLERDTDVRFETVALDDVLAATAGASQRVVILDVCRNNPAGAFDAANRCGAQRQPGFGELNEALLGDETLVACATAAGTTAADGTGRNSPYTAALFAYLEQPLEIGIIILIGFWRQRRGARGGAVDEAVNRTPWCDREAREGLRHVNHSAIHITRAAA